MSANIFRKFLVLVVFATSIFGIAQGVSPVQAGGPTEVIKNIQFDIPNPCNGHWLLFTADAHVKSDANGFQLSFTNAKAVDSATGVRYVETYTYGTGGPAVFLLNLRLIATGGSGSGLEYSEHDQFVWNPATGNLTRVVISQSCK